MVLHKADWGFGFSKIVIQSLGKQGACFSCGEQGSLFTVSGENSGLPQCKQCAQDYANDLNEQRGR